MRSLKCPVRRVHSSSSLSTAGMLAGLPSYLIGVLSMCVGMRIPLVPGVAPSASLVTVDSVLDIDLRLRGRPRRSRYHVRRSVVKESEIDSIETDARTHIYPNSRKLALVED